MNLFVIKCFFSCSFTVIALLGVIFLCMSLAITRGRARRFDNNHLNLNTSKHHHIGCSANLYILSKITIVITFKLNSMQKYYFKFSLMV